MGVTNKSARVEDMKLLINLCALASVALGVVTAQYAPAPYVPAPAPYVPAPAPYVPAPAPYHAPAPYVPAPAPLVAHAVHAPLAHAVHGPVVAHAIHAPAPYAPALAYHEEPPKDYSFGYDVHGVDEYGNPNNHGRTESRVGPTVKGQYRVELPDCRVQIVDYFVDEYKKYHADVKYEGVPCPDKSLLKHKPAYVAPAPGYAPAPLVGHAVHAPLAHAVHGPVVAHAVHGQAPLVAHPFAHPVAHAVHAPLGHAVHAPLGHAVHAPLAHPAPFGSPFVHHG